MIYPIVSYGAPVLRRQAAEVPEDYPELSKLVADMFETMEKAGGVGLAAPQIDLSLRLFVVDVPPIRLDDGPSAGLKTPAEPFRKAFINPQLLKSIVSRSSRSAIRTNNSSGMRKPTTVMWRGCSSMNTII